MKKVLGKKAQGKVSGRIVTEGFHPGLTTKEKENPSGSLASRRRSESSGAQHRLLQGNAFVLTTVLVSVQRVQMAVHVQKEFMFVPSAMALTLSQSMSARD